MRGRSRAGTLLPLRDGRHRRLLLVDAVLPLARSALVALALLIAAARLRGGGDRLGLDAELMACLDAVLAELPVGLTGTVVDVVWPLDGDGRRNVLEALRGMHVEEKEDFLCALGQMSGPQIKRLVAQPILRGSWSIK